MRISDVQMGTELRIKSQKSRLKLPCLLALATLRLLNL